MMARSRLVKATFAASAETSSCRNTRFQATASPRGTLAWSAVQSASSASIWLPPRSSPHLAIVRTPDPARSASGSVTRTTEMSSVPAPKSKTQNTSPGLIRAWYPTAAAVASSTTRSRAVPSPSPTSRTSQSR
jgi:hypothetical protein